MFKLKYALIISILIVGTSCSHNFHHHDQFSTELTLNNNQKWKSDQHTMDRIINMKKIVFNSKMMGLTALKNSLDVELNSLIQGCTMEGQSHDTLHIYLEELIPLIDKLENAEKKISQDAYNKIKKLLTLYSDYFETGL